MFSIPGLADLARRNQRLITVAQYLVGASSLLVPTRSEHYEVYTEASYSLSQLISFCNSVVLDNPEVTGTSVQNQSAVVSSSVRSLDYYLWVVTRVITHLEVLLEKAAGAFWGDNSKERSILILAIESLKAMSRLFVLLSQSNGKQTMILNWSKAYVSRGDSLDLSHYKLWYKVQHERMKAQTQSPSANTENINIRTARQKSDINNGFSNTDSDGFAVSESAFSSPFVGRRSGLVLKYTSGQDFCLAKSDRDSSSHSFSSPSSSSPFSPSSPSPSSPPLSTAPKNTELVSVSVLEVNPTPCKGRKSAVKTASSSTSTSPSTTTPTFPTTTTSFPSSDMALHLSHHSPSLSSRSKKLSLSTHSFHSSSSGVTDNESTTSTDSATEQSQNRDHEICENTLKNEVYFPEIYPNCAPEGAFSATLNPNRTAVQNTIYNNYCNNYDIMPDITSYRQGDRVRAKEKEKEKGIKGEQRKEKGAESDTEGEGDGEEGSEISLNEKNENSTESKNNLDQISVISCYDYIPPKSPVDGNYDSSDDSNDTDMGENPNDNVDSENDGKAEIYVSDDEEEKKENDSSLLSNNPHKKSLKTKENVEESKIEEELTRCNSSNRIIRKSGVEEYPFTADQALFVSEILYVLRPLVLAWGVHFIKERRRKRNIEKNVTIVKTNQSGVENGEKTSGINNTENDIKMENTLFSTMEDFFPLLLSLAVEVLSIRLTTIALTMAREGEMGKESESEREERERGIGRERERDRNGSRTSGSPQHTNSNHINNTNSTTHTGGAPKGKKLTEHKWDLELSRRKLLLLYYLVRGQTFNRATLPLLQMASEFLKYVPIVNSLPSYAINMLSYLNRSHFRSSSSS